MDTIKSISITAFFIVLLASNLGIIIEGLLVIFPSSTSYGFTGNTTEKTTDLEMGTVAIAADKMNVFYIGVENPITLSAAGVPSSQLKVTSTGLDMKGTGAKRIVTAKRKGIATITLSGGGLAKTEFKFRVKRIPDPVVKCAGKMDERKH